MKPLFLILTKHWFDEIKSGRKTVEYREATPFWTKRIRAYHAGQIHGEKFKVIFQLGYAKNAPRLIADIADIDLIDRTYNIRLSNVKAG